jgi:hypothetical protein
MNHGEMRGWGPQVLHKRILVDLRRHVCSVLTRGQWRVCPEAVERCEHFV